MTIRRSLMAVAVAGTLVSCHHHGDRLPAEGSGAPAARATPIAFEHPLATWQSTGGHGRNRWAMPGKGPGPGEHGRGMHGLMGNLYPPGLVLRLAPRAGLRDDQTAKIRQDLFDTNLRVVDLESKAHKSRIEIERLLSAAQPDEKALFAQVDEAAKAGAEIKKQRLDLMLRVRQILTPEQRKQLDELRRYAWRGPGEDWHHGRGSLGPAEQAPRPRH